jgi:hypothetical protein
VAADVRRMENRTVRAAERRRTGRAGLTSRAVAALHVHSVTFDAADPPAQGRFWAQVFEAPEPEVPNPYVALVHPAEGPQLLFIQVPEAKVAKNRCHLDLHADSEQAVDDQVARLTALGATVVGTYREYGTYWASLRDHEGNEVCVGTPSPPH